MKSEEELLLKFWGVRGSTPTPQAENLEYGGNTPCIEVRSGSNILIFDAGTGLRMLGRSLTDENPDTPIILNVFLTHFHWDHIQGLPFFSPAYNGANALTYYSGSAGRNLREILDGHMAAPYFPVQFQELVACRSFRTVTSDAVKIGSLAISAFPLNHPQGASGYRIESPHGVIVYATDLEHGDPKLDSILRDNASGADVLIFDSQYTPEEYEHHRGWGHSTWLEGTRVARDAGVGQLILFHHDPWHTDVMCRSIVADATRQFENTTGAMEGSVIRLTKSVVARPTKISGV